MLPTLEAPPEDALEASASANSRDDIGDWEAHAVLDGFGGVAEGCRVRFRSTIGAEGGGDCRGEKRMRTVRDEVEKRFIFWGLLMRWWDRRGVRGEV